MAKINSITNYLPPKSLGEGLKRVKQAMGCAGECIYNGNGHRLYETFDKSTVYMTIGELHKTPNIVATDRPFLHTDYDTFAGTVLRIRNSSNAGKRNTRPNQLLQLMRTRFFSNSVKDSSGKEYKPIHAITDFGIINSKEGKPVVKYGYGKHKGIEGIAGTVKEIKSEEVPKEYTGVNAPDGNIVYYLKDTVRNGKRSVEMKMFETGLNVPIL